MTELNFHINKLHNLQYIGDWKEVYSHIYKEIYDIVYKSYSIRKNYYLEELEQLNKQMMKLPYIQSNEDKLIFRKSQKHIIDFLYRIKEENKKIFIIYGKDTSMKDKVSSYLGRLKIDLVDIENIYDTEISIKEFQEKAKDCEYAIALLSADNQVKVKNEADFYRASQKVIFQLGYFLATAGKKNIIILTPPDKKIEPPFIFEGIEQKTFDKEGIWKTELVKHLKTTGIYIDEELIHKI